MNTALIAMSGGVDSSVAALIMAGRGFGCVGGMMKLFNDDEYGGGERSCCSVEDANDAFAAASKIGIPFYVLNFADMFKEYVIKRFAAAYLNGETPNPCIDCNRYLKFDALQKRAAQLDLYYIATGHYARVEYDVGGGRYLLKKAVDVSKDQSYMLYTMTQEALKRTVFPLGGLLKDEVREMAVEHGLVNAKKRDSQDICFVSYGHYADFIARYTGAPAKEGCFVDTAGNVLGCHKGIARYTVGQRKGLGLSGCEPLYVRDIRHNDNTVIVGGESDLYAKTLVARDINLIAVDRFDAPVRLKAKLRYRHKEQSAVVWQLEQDVLRVEFDEPQRAITKGQAVVLYDGDVVVGGGTIGGVVTV